MNHITSILLFMLLTSAPAQAQEWLWGKGSTGNNVSSWPVATDIRGNAYVAGVSSGIVSFDNIPPTFISADDLCVIAKYDTYGDFLWARNIPNAAPINMTTDTAGNCYLLGWTSVPSIVIGAITLTNAAYPNTQYFIAKYSPEGDVIWAKNAGGRLGVPAIPPVIFSSTCTAKMAGLGAVATGPDGNIYVTAAFNLPSVTLGSATLTNQDPSGATDDIMLVKYDSLGNVVWAKSSGGSGEDIPFGLTVTPAGAIYIAGMFNSDSVAFGPSVITDTSTSMQKWNAFIARYNASGSPVWASGSGGTGMVYASGIASDTSGNVYLTGGSAENSITFGGTTMVNLYPGKPIQYLIKLDSSNNAGWYETIGSPTGGIAYGYGVAVSPAGYVWTSGAFSDEVNIAGNILNIPAASVDPIFIACFDTAGYYVASGALQSGSDKQAGIASDPWGNAYLCSDYKYPCAPFIVADDVLAGVAAGESWQYLAKYVFNSSVGPGNGGGPIAIHTYLDTSMCPNDTISVIAPRGYAAYTWNDGSSDTLLKITVAGTYSVAAIGGDNTMATETFNVTGDNALCNCGVIMPDAFTPNGDDRNDTYGPIFESGCAINFYAFSIYNRWGQCVFYTEDPYAKWDGTFQGKKAELDVYMFYLVYSTNPSYPQHKKKGDVTLVR